MIKVRIFDEPHEKDLETDINMFLENIDGDYIDIQFRTSISMFSEEQVYCFSALIIYDDDDNK